MIEQPLRAIAEQEAVYPAWDIPQRWFGRTELTRRFAQGPLTTITTEVVSHAFTLTPCGCKVSHKDQCGGVCTWCYAELDELRSKGELPATFSLVQQEWMATPCKKHYDICSYPLCVYGLCPKHAIPGLDGNPYCPLHAPQVEYDQKLAVLREEKGILYAKCFDFFHGLLFHRRLR